MFYLSFKKRDTLNGIKTEVNLIQPKVNLTMIKVKRVVVDPREWVFSYYDQSCSYLYFYTHKYISIHINHIVVAAYIVRLLVFVIMALK